MIPLQLDTLADVQAGLLRLLGAMNVAQAAEAEAIGHRRVDKAVHRHHGLVGAYLEDLSDLHVQFIVRNTTPVVQA